jgi:hypothetical protein
LGRNVNAPRGGENTKELRERLERHGGLELDLHLVHVAEVLGEGSVVVGVIPVPSGYALVVVFQYPAQTFHVGLGDPKRVSEVSPGHFTMVEHLLIDELAV